MFFSHNPTSSLWGICICVFSSSSWWWWLNSDKWGAILVHLYLHTWNSRCILHRASFHWREIWMDDIFVKWPNPSARSKTLILFAKMWPFEKPLKVRTPPGDSLVLRLWKRCIEGQRTMTEEDIYHFQFWHLYCHLYEAFHGGDFDGNVSPSALFALQVAARREMKAGQ